MSPNDPDVPDSGEAAESAADPLVGRTLADRYRILSKLGEGAMGTVYLGEHLRMGRRDAIKVLRGGLAQDTEAIARFTRGARNVATIRHTNVCAIYDFSDTAEGVRYLAMEYIEGETLRDALERETRLDIERAIDIAGQVADALQAAHEAGVVHRDLKPGNIMLCRRADGSDAVKVVDFDIAKGPGEPEGEEVTRVGFVVGTPEYMSPEQLTGERLDGRSDLYSLGVVLYRMVTGVMPFRAVSAQEIMIQRLTTEALRLSDLLPAGAYPAALEPVLAQSLARRAAERQPSAAVFAREIRAALAAGAGSAFGVSAAAAAASASAAGSGSAAAAPFASEPAREMPPTRVAAARVAARVPFTAAARKRAMLAVGAVAAIVIVAVGATVLLRDREPPSLAPETAAADTLESGVDVTAGDPAATSPDDISAAQDPTDPEPEPAGQESTRTSVPQTTSGLGPGANVGAVLDRQLGSLSGNPSRSELLAIRDTASLAWEAAITRRDSADAAFVLAQAALILEDDAGCARWTQRGAALDGVGPYTQNSPWSMLLQVCR